MKNRRREVGTLRSTTSFSQSIVEVKLILTRVICYDLP